MPRPSISTTYRTPSLETYLLSQIDFRQCLELQKRLVHEIGARDDGQIVLLLCEHPTIVTVGRGGSAEQVAVQSRMLRNGQVDVLWVNRGGGCMVHCPGQLAVYPIVPLQWHEFSVGEFLDRFQAGIVETLHEMNIHCRSMPGGHGVHGRTGQLASFGVAVRDWVSYYGAYLNVCPSMGLFRMVDAGRSSDDRIGSLLAERGRAAKMTTVRATLVRHLADTFGCERSHLYTSHPLLRRDSPEDTDAV